MTKALTICIALAAIPQIAVAGSVSGKITSSKGTLPEAQSACVVWIEGPPSASEGGETPVMSQSGVQFEPRVMTVVAGQTVSFPNQDDVAHNVFSLSPANKFKLGIYPKGDTREVTFDKTGVIDLFCSIHRHMHAVIVVTPNEFHVQSTVGGEFKIENVPPGDYVLKAWNAAHKVVEAKVAVTGDGNVDAPISFVE
jgi:plastocyanin